MPVYLDPKQTFDFVLTADRDKQNPATFEIRILTARKHKEILDVIEKEGGGIEAAVKVIKLGLAGWRNFGDLVYDANNIDAILTAGELAEICGTIIAQKDIDEIIRKKSESPSASSTG